MSNVGSPFNRRAVLNGLLAGGALAATPILALQSSPHPAARPRTLWQRALPATEDLVSHARLGGQTGFTLREVATGRLIEGRDSTLPLPPASVTKAASAIYALDTLGSDFRYETRLMSTAPLTGGRIDGDLLLVGDGDPTLDTAALGALLDDLRAAGLREVTGTLRVHAGALPFIRTIDPGQPDHLGYSPAISGLNLNFNRVYFEWRRKGTEYDITMDARTGDLRPQVRVSSMSVAPRDMPIYTYEQRGTQDHWTVARGALGAEGGRWLPVRIPSSYAADVFTTLAGGSGLRLKMGPELDQLPAGARTLAKHQSAPLAEILNGMLRYSTNITAECVGLRASLALGAHPLTLDASAARMSAWLQARTSGGSNIRFVDHSGLGDRSRISGADMTALLSAGSTFDTLSPLLKPYRLKDPDTGRSLARPPAEVLAKTGTLNFVSGLAGYIAPPSGRVMAFAIFSADTERRAALTRAQRDRPEGARGWASRARALQNELVLRWSRLYGA